MFITQGVNPFTRKPFDLFDWWALEPFMRYRRVSETLTTTTRARTSRLGGCPEFIDEWPQGIAGPLPFVAQLDMAELARQASNGWPRSFPRRGVASLFFDEREQDGSQFALHFDDGKQRRPPRGTLPKLGASACLRVTKKENASHHRIGGAPTWLQSPYAVEGHYRSGAYRRYPSVVAALARAGVAKDAFARNDKKTVHAGRLLDAAGTSPEQLTAGLRECCLLFQIDAAPALGLHFGSMGRLYVFGEPKSLRAGKAPVAWATMQYG